MAQLYFHCSNSNGVVIDQRGAMVEDLAEARDHAACIVRSFLTTHSPEDWRDWMLHVSDELDDEIFADAVRLPARQAALRSTPCLPHSNHASRLVAAWMRSGRDGRD